MNFNFISKKNITHFFILLPLLWCFSGMYALSNGDKILNLLVIIAVVTRFSSLGTRGIKEHFIENKILWVILANFIFALIAFFTYGVSSNRFRALTLMIIFLSILPTSLIENISFKKLVYFLTISLMVFLFSQFLDGNLFNRNWSINPIRVGIVSAFVINANIFFALKSKKTSDKYLSILFSLLSFIPLILSLSRGPWLSLFISSLVLIISCYGLKKINIKLTLVVLATIILIAFTLQKPIMKRIDATNYEIEQIQKNDLNTSVGIRIQLWKAGIEIIKSNWLLGVGDTGQFVIKRNMVENGKLSQEASKFVHFHNQWINDLAKYGILGLVLTISFITIPIFYSSNRKSRPLVLMLISIYIVLSLTDMPFERSHNLIFYLISMYILLNDKIYPKQSTLGQ